MNKDSRFISQPKPVDEDLLDEYDFSQAVRGNPRQYLRDRSSELKRKMAILKLELLQWK